MSASIRINIAFDRIVRYEKKICLGSFFLRFTQKNSKKILRCVDYYSQRVLHFKERTKAKKFLKFLFKVFLNILKSSI